LNAGADKYINNDAPIKLAIWLKPFCCGEKWFVKNS
jgi:hypothetical protein